MVVGWRWKEKVELWGAEGEEDAALFLEMPNQVWNFFEGDMSLTQYLVYTGPGVTEASAICPDLRSLACGASLLWDPLAFSFSPRCSSLPPG